MEEGIRIVPERGIDRELMAFLSRSLSEAFHCPCVLDEPMWHPVAAYQARRGQYSAESILRRLAPEADEHVLGVVDVDIFVPPYAYVLGLAHPDKRRAVIALPRLRERYGQDPAGDQALRARLVDEAIHQIAHTYRSEPCDYVRCVLSLKDLMLDDAPRLQLPRAWKYT